MNETSKRQMSHRLSYVMGALRLTQKQVAQQAECSQPFVSSVLSGQRPVSSGLADAMEKRYGARKEWLLRGVGDPWKQGKGPVDADPFQPLDDVEDSAPKKKGARTELPVFDDVVSSPDAEAKRFLGMRRVIPWPLWQRTRYFRRVLESDEIDAAGILPGDYLMLDARLPALSVECWQPTLCIVQWERRLRVGWVTRVETLRGKQAVCVGATAEDMAGRPVLCPDDFALKAVIIRVERDARLWWP